MDRKPGMFRSVGDLVGFCLTTLPLTLLLVAATVAVVYGLISLPSREW